jgi:hypothetical protein
MVALAMLLACAPAARAAWVVDEHGDCVERWQPHDLLRGPTAIVNAPLWPFRTMAGGAVYAWNTAEWWPAQIAGLGPAVILISGIAGAVESTWWIATGVADTLTGGYFSLAPARATELSLTPEVSAIIADAEPAAKTDRCGRPLGTGDAEP